jgi:hypothetical protein
MINASQIKEHMEVKGSDGKHVGTVLGAENERDKIASGGMDHYIDIATLGGCAHVALARHRRAWRRARPS